MRSPRKKAERELIKKIARTPERYQFHNETMLQDLQTRNSKPSPYSIGPRSKAPWVWPIDRK